VGRYQKPGLFPEVVAHLYAQFAEVWKLDNEFAAQWASWYFANGDKKDLMVIMAAFMLLQNRAGEVIKEDGEQFFDEDFRQVGEAMCLLRKKGGFDPKLLLRINAVLQTPQVVKINRAMGFGKSARRAATGRYYDLITKWLRYLENNQRALDNLVKGGFRQQVRSLCQMVRFKPISPRFFKVMRWKQEQCKDGHRALAIGDKVAAADTWKGLSERDICIRILEERPSYKVVVGKLPASKGITPAIMMAVHEAGVLSDKDYIQLTPTFEELGLLKDASIDARWKAAMAKAEDQRARNIAKNVRSADAKEQLEKAADVAVEKKVAEVIKNFRVYVMVDISGSMHQAIAQAKEYISKFVGAFPLDKLHVITFRSDAQVVDIKANTREAVIRAFRGKNAGGGTSHVAAARLAVHTFPLQEDEEALFFWIGDQQNENVRRLADTFRDGKLMPSAFGTVTVRGMNGTTVSSCAAELGIPCFELDPGMFDDVYAVPQILRGIIEATPVREQAARAIRTVPDRESMVDIILKTPLLKRPAWAA
jgi:hypothetical protein